MNINLSSGFETMKLIKNRILSHSYLYLSIFVGFFIASTVVAIAPTYNHSLKLISLNKSVEQTSDDFIDIALTVPNIPVNSADIQSSRVMLDQLIESYLSEFSSGHTRILKSPNLLVGTPKDPLAEFGTKDEGPIGWVQSMDGFESMVRVIEGRFPSDQVLLDDEGRQYIEGVLSPFQSEFFGLEVGSMATFSPSMNFDRLGVLIVGIVEPNDKKDRFWHFSADGLLEPRVFETPPEIDPDYIELSQPVSIFVNKNPFAEAFESIFPGSLGKSTSFIYLEKNSLRNVDPDSLDKLLKDLQVEISESFPSSGFLTGLKPILSSLAVKRFFTSIPMVLLISMMVMTVLFYLGMLVSFLSSAREEDFFRLSSRGGSRLQLLKIYLLEGIFIAFISVILSPFASLAVVYSSGKLPNISSLTNGQFLPVELVSSSFLVSGVTGAVCLILYLAPVFLTNRNTSIFSNLRLSRPPIEPFFQKYFIDFALLILAAIVFWELNQRGSIVSGGIHTANQINETALLAPMLYLLVVVLMFLRLFPALVRFLSGESVWIVNFLALASIGFSGILFLIQGWLDSDLNRVITPLLFLLLIGFLYWCLNKITSKNIFGLCIGIELLLSVVLFWMYAPKTVDPLIFSLIIIILLGPLRIIYLLLGKVIQIAPLGYTLTLWKFSRNPLQYIWPILLLSLVTCIGVLSATIGTTLDKSGSDRVSYQVGSDYLISSIPRMLIADRSSVDNELKAFDNDINSMFAYRSSGKAITASLGNSFEFLGIDSFAEAKTLWFRDDFSDEEIGELFSMIRPKTIHQPILIPEETTHVGMNFKSSGNFKAIKLRLYFIDNRGVVGFSTLGDLGSSEWITASAAIPENLKHPMNLASVQIFEHGHGPVATPGALSIGDIFAFSDVDSNKVILENFEGPLDWSPIAISLSASDLIQIETNDQNEFCKCARFEFGRLTHRGSRGIFNLNFGSVLPIMVSNSFLIENDSRVGDQILIKIFDNPIKSVIVDSVEYFPTLDPANGGFVIADLDSVMSYMNIVTDGQKIRPTEIFVHAPNASDNEFRARLNQIGAVNARSEEFENLNSDPLIALGWKMAVIASFVVIFLIGGLGYLTYLLVLRVRSRREFAFMQTFGLSKIQMLIILHFEHITIGILGLFLGTWAALQMSEILISSVAVTEYGGRFLPPFVLIVNWWMIVPIYVSIMALMIVCLIISAYQFSRIDFNSISRAEE
ncbi:MAG: FtsX-like permease family protein [Dehalococcoidia bacterium]